MQYIWQHRLWPQAHSQTVDGRRIQVLDPGQLNTNSGPDFFNAKIKIDGQLWAGDVEIHIRATDWHRHGHQVDPAYDSVILHVVDRDDTIIRRSDGQPIPQMRMPCNPAFHQRYAALAEHADRDLPCASLIPSVPAIIVTDWIQSLAFERLYQKSDRIAELLSSMQSDWDAVCYITLARSLGFGINGDPFQRLATSLPLRFISRHADSLFTIQALLFGQADLLPPEGQDSYADQLRREYNHFAHKFGIKPPQSLSWKFSRMRPANFPHRRIAILASLLHSHTRLLQLILGIESIDQARQLFSPTLSGYWADHYNFSRPAPSTPSLLSNSSIISLIINTVVPIQYTYATLHSDDVLAQRAITLLQLLPSEKNSIVDLFSHAGIKAPDALTTQALIQLRQNYCLTRKCLYCRFGHRLLAADARRPD